MASRYSYWGSDVADLKKNIDEVTRFLEKCRLHQLIKDDISMRLVKCKVLLKKGQPINGASNKCSRIGHGSSSDTGTH